MCKLLVYYGEHPSLPFLPKIKNESLPTRRNSNFTANERRFEFYFSAKMVNLGTPRFRDQTEFFY